MRGNSFAHAFWLTKNDILVTPVEEEERQRVEDIGTTLVPSFTSLQIPDNGTRTLSGC